MKQSVSKQIRREKKTVKVMIEIFCRAHHQATETLCASCEALLNYAYDRLDYCVFGDKKPVCSECGVHCYKPEKREQITDVMRYSGPRMFLKRPDLAVMHLLHEQRSKIMPPCRPKKS